MKKKNSKSKIIKITGITLALLLLVGAILEVTGTTNIVKLRNKKSPTAPSSSETINYSPPTEEEKEEVETNKTSDDKIKDAPPTTPATPTDNNVVLSSYEQQDSKDVVVQTQLNGVGWKTCTLTLTLGGKKVVKTAETLYQPSFSTCLGFSVPFSELGQAGNWQIDLSVSNNDGQPHNATPATIKVAQ